MCSCPKTTLKTKYKKQIKRKTFSSITSFLSREIIPLITASFVNKWQNSVLCILFVTQITTFKLMGSIKNTKVKHLKQQKWENKVVKILHLNCIIVPLTGMNR